MSRSTLTCNQNGSLRSLAAGGANVGVGIVFLAVTAISLWPLLPAGAGNQAADPQVTCFRTDPNYASKAELMLLPGIGEALSEAIIDYREAFAPGAAFRCAEDLDRVHRIGPVTVAKLRPYLIFPALVESSTDSGAGQP